MDEVNINDGQLGACIQECRRAMVGLSTLETITVCYNLAAGKFRLCCISAPREIVTQLAVELYAGLMQQIEEAYEE